ncbi:putative spermidine/putrescine transport system substrate-binding protein [Ruegeria halocynthiae]|uniref:Putative spermidine/putrescine transport system substrate-binding protein n=1 Tax=Ruegeria halocynthiae TaxID=985054 RepID=A0A1H2YI81_9RHOB|nr:putative spermidine/putrescine transport system substrate-binding protein [Ruegeria halocynthiae]
MKLAFEGAVEPIDFSVVNTDGIDGALYADEWIAVFTFATVIGWNTDTVEKAPSNWAEFWDVENFPGARALYNSAQSMLEIALMADGVAPADLYPLDVDRAFEKLEEIKPEVVT